MLGRGLPGTAAGAAVLLVCSTPVRAGEAVYERKDTWAATLNSMRVRYREESKADASAGRAKALSLGVWYGTGQHSSPGLSHRRGSEEAADMQPSAEGRG